MKDDSYFPRILTKEMLTPPPPGVMPRRLYEEKKQECLQETPANERQNLEALLAMHRRADLLEACKRREGTEFLTPPEWQQEIQDIDNGRFDGFLQDS